MVLGQVSCRNVRNSAVVLLGHCCKDGVVVHAVVENVAGKEPE